MEKRPALEIGLRSEIFKDYYYLKQDLVDFCRTYGLQTTGGKIELTERISKFLDTGEKNFTKISNKKKNDIGNITINTLVEEYFECSEKHRTFFKTEIGKNFSFNVTFQNWLKQNTGKTYKDAIVAYKQIIENKKTTKPQIDKQFEYNTYIRDFFTSNKDKTLNDAIKCWNYKKSLKGHNKYETTDLDAIKNN